MDEKQPEKFQFASFELIPHEWSFRRDGKEVPLNQQDFKILCCLAARAPNVAERKELLSAAWEKTGAPNYLDGSIHRLRKVLGDKNSIKTIRRVGHKLMLHVTRTNESANAPPTPVPLELHRTPKRKAYDSGHFGRLGALHVHVDGERERTLVDRLVRQFDADGYDSKKSVVVDFAKGPQRKQSKYRALYNGHTPGIDKEELDYFSTHLFFTFGQTKRRLARLLEMLKDTEGIVIEVERIIQKINDSNDNEIAATWLHEFPSLRSGDVGYEQWNTGFESNLVEVHYSVNIPRDPKGTDEAPFKCQELVELSSSIGIDVGGWFRFKEPDVWAYRSNMFASEVPDIEADRNNLKVAMSEIGNRKGFVCQVTALAEQALGVWKTPLIHSEEPRTVFQLSEWEGNFPDLRDFWVVTPNFLGDKENDIEAAMIHNLQRGVHYTYFLSSVADYMRLRSFTDRLRTKVKAHINVDEQIRAVMLFKDVSSESAFDEVFRYRDYHGCFIANPLNKNGELSSDADGYELLRSPEPGKICGGRTMELNRLKRIIELLTPLMSDRSLQGLRVPSKREAMESVIPIMSVVCIELRKAEESLGQLMSRIENESIGKILTQFDLLIATEVSKLGGRVIKSIEPGYLLGFDNESAALKCAEQILSGFNSHFNSDLTLRIAIDRGDAWRLMRAHGNDYCGLAVARCRELLKSLEDGQIATTGSFARALGRVDKMLSERLEHTGHFAFEGHQRSIQTIRREIKNG